MSGSDSSFLGKGWAFPPGFSDNGRDVLQAADETDILQSLTILLSTARGERIMREDFGCDLEKFVFEDISQDVINDLTEYINDAILYYEPRITLNSVSIDESGLVQGLINISLDYTVYATNSRFNLVYPFYLNEASFANA
jgi:uncharacterized protein